MVIEFGNYQLIEKIGKGGMAEVFLARSYGAEGIEKQLVIKRILPEFSQNRRFVDMFIAEAKIAMGLNHPNIVQIYDFGKVDNDYYLAMEYVDGVTVAQLMQACRRSGQTLQIGDAIYIGVELAKGLDYAHRRLDRYGKSLELVHRDISPQNILISRDGTVKLVDFGIAKATSISEDGPREVKGKYSYMSPEQAWGEDVDQRSDLFSLGVVLFEMICGRSLFRQKTPEETLSLVKSAVVPDISSLNPGVSGQLEHLLYKALARLPGDRYGTAREFQLDLTRVLYGLSDVYDGVTTAAHLRRVERYLGVHETSEISQVSDSSEREMKTVATGGELVRQSVDAETVNEVSGDHEVREQSVNRRRKEVVILSGGTYGLAELQANVGMNRWHQVFQEYRRIVDAIAYKNEGVVHRLDAAGFVVLLGIPVSSENDCERAAYMAMDLHEAVAGLSIGLESPIHLGIGIAIGEVVLEQEARHGSRRYRWSFHGLSNEIAEGLSGAAFAREILLGSFVYRRVRRSFHCSPVDEVRVSENDGSTYLVQSYRMESPKSGRAQFEELRSSYRAVYGHEITRKVLRAEYRKTLLDKKASCVVLSGARGIGKSIVVDDFLSSLDRRDVRIVRGVIGPFEQQIPLASAVGLLRGVLQLGSQDDLRILYEQLETRLRAMFYDSEETEVVQLLHALGSLFNLTFADSAFDALKGNERRRRIFEGIQRVVVRASEIQPLVLAFDDAHHIDAMTLQATTEFFEKHRDVAVFCVCTVNENHPTIASKAWQNFVALDMLRIETLHELNADEAEQLVREMLSVYGVGEDRLVSQILACSGGNPLYIKEVIEGLAERGWLADREGLAAVEAIEEDPNWLPVSVEGLIGARIDRLEMTEKLVLQHVAVLWASFKLSDARLVIDDPVVSKVMNDDKMGSDVLEGLVKSGFLVRTDVAEAKESGEREEAVERGYRFSNLLTQEVATRGLVPEEFSRLNRRLAGVLLKKRETLGLRGSVMIARYYEGAGEHDLSVEYYRQTAEEAFANLGAVECVRLCELLLEKCPPGDVQRIKVLMLLQTALLEAGTHVRVVAVLEELYELVFEKGQRSEQLDVLVRLSRYHYDRSSMREAREFLDKARRLAASCDDDLSRVKVWNMEAVLAIADSQSARALVLVDQIIEVYSNANSGSVDQDYCEELTAAHNLRGVVFRQAGRYEEALVAYETALEFSRTCKYGRQTQMLLLNSGVALVYLHRITEALERYERALEHCRRLGHVRGEASIRVNMGHAYYLLGQNARAITSLEQGILLGQKLVYNQNVADGQISLGVCFLADGELKAAESALHEGLRLADSIPHPYLSIHATLALARVHLASGLVDNARIALIQAEDALERAHMAKMLWGEAVALSLMARALDMLGRRPAAIEHSRRAVALLDVSRVFDMEEILYFHYRILAGEAEHATAEQLEEGMAALERAYVSLMETGRGIEDAGDRAAFMGRLVHEQIVAEATAALADGVGQG